MTYVIEVDGSPLIALRHNYSFQFVSFVLFMQIRRTICATTEIIFAARLGVEAVELKQ